MDTPITTQKVKFVINDHMIAYLRFFAKLGFPFSKKALAMVDNAAEIVFPIKRWFRSDWSIDEKVFERQVARDLVKNQGTFHSMLEFHPYVKHYGISFDDDTKREENIRAIKAQILLAARLDKDNPRTKIVVFHPGGSTKNTPDEFIDALVHTFGPCLALADENNVQITFEPDLGRGKIHYYGSAKNYRTVVALVQKLTDLAPRNRLSMPVSVTFDLSHTLIENQHNWDAVQDIIREFGPYICYAHINHPVQFAMQMSRAPVVNKRLGEYPTIVTFWKLFTSSSDGHNPIYRVPEQEKLEETLKLLADKTRIREFGRVNLEVGTRWDRGINFFRCGASGYGTYKSLVILDKIFNGSHEAS